MADAGWYPDAHDPNQQHYFDGQDWTGHYRPNPAAPTDDTVRRGDLPGREQRDQPSQQEPAQQWPQQQEPAAQQWAQPAAQPATQQWGTPAEPQQQWAQPAYQPQDQQYGAPARQWDPQGQQGQGQQGQGQPGYGAAPWQPGPAASGPSGSRRRKPLLIAGVVVALLVAGLVTFFVWPSDDPPSLTYRGKGISNTDDTLTSAETAVDKAVADRKGNKNDDTRCYFAKPQKPESGAKASDIDDSLRCGPVLFVDGEKTAAYLSVPVTETASGSSVKLEVRDGVGDIEPAALDSSINLERPDGQKPPTENGGAGTLTVPRPPAGEKDVITTATLRPDDQVKPVGKSVVGKNLKVTLVRAGELSRYGVGDDARSAPAGQRLVAFQISYGSGDVDKSGQDPAMLVPSGGTARAIPAAEGDTYVIAAIPTAGASIVLRDGGLTQSIALPTGATGPGTIAVLQRANRTAILSSRVKVPFALRKGSKTGKVTYTATATIAALDFWAPGNTNVHPTNPANAILSVKLNYTDDGVTYGFNPSLLKLRVGSQVYSARNVAPAGRVNNVFEVPASFTSGTLRISGSTKVDGITLRVTTPRDIAIRIPA